VFLREYVGLLLVIFPLLIFLYHLLKQKESFIKSAWFGFLFCIPFITCDSLWIIRNYRVTERIIPLATLNDAYGKLYSRGWFALDDLVYTWGENASPFDNTTLGYYFREPQEKIDVKFPPGIFRNVTTYNADSLINLRKLYKQYYFTADTTESNRAQERILTLCSLYKHDYVSHNFFRYWVVKPVKDLKLMVIFSGAGYLPLPVLSKSTVLQKVTKLGFSAFYYFILLFGLAGIVFYFRSKTGKHPVAVIAAIIVTLVPLTIIFTCPIEEARYFVHSFAILFLFASYSLSRLFFKARIE
jgi:hypothetical protein